MNKILVSGLYFSGSSAVVDLLSEYESVGRVPGEFDFFRRQGLIGDHIEGTIDENNPCNFRNIERALKYNLKLYYPSRIKEQVELSSLLKYWIACTPLKKYYKNGLLKNVTKKADQIKNLRISLESAATRENKMKIGKDFLSKYIKPYSHDKKHILIDQPIMYYAHEQTWPEFYNPYKLIIVKRDIKDQIADLIQRKIINFDIETPARGIREIFGSDRIGAIKYEATASKARLKRANEFQNKFGKDKILIISFEDLVNKYDITKKQIESFLNIPELEHVSKKAKFNPDVSRLNIGIYKNILTEEEISLIEKISNE